MNALEEQAYIYMCHNSTILFNIPLEESSIFNKYYLFLNLPFASEHLG